MFGAFCMLILSRYTASYRIPFAYATPTIDGFDSYNTSVIVRVRAATLPTTTAPIQTAIAHVRLMAGTEDLEAQPIDLSTNSVHDKRWVSVCDGCQGSTGKQADTHLSESHSDASEQV